jgi:hypothetical protein
MQITFISKTNLISNALKTNTLFTHKMDHDSEYLSHQLVQALGGQELLLGALREAATSDRDADVLAVEVDVSLLMASCDPWLGCALMQDAAGDILL